jgi:hypothetical protein
MRHRLVALALVISAVRLGAQTMDVPVAMQVPLFVKVLSFDRNSRPQASDTLLVGIAYQGGNRASVSARDEVARALQQIGQSARMVSIDLDRETLADALRRERLHMLYVAPLRAIDITDVAQATRSAAVTSVTGVARYVTQGVSVGVRLQGDRPKLLVNLEAARAEGADFSSELLRLVQVIP